MAGRLTGHLRAVDASFGRFIPLHIADSHASLSITNPRPVGIET